MVAEARPFKEALLVRFGEVPDRTTAELSIEEKDAISHRGKALREIAPIVARALEA